jgi:hypothetical protein
LQAGVKFAKLKGDEAIESDDCISLVDEAEAELDLQLDDDPARIAAHLGLLSNDLSIVTAEEAAEVQATLDLKHLTDAYTLLAKARKLEERAVSKIRDVISRQPSLATLASTLAPIGKMASTVEYTSTSFMKEGELSTPIPSGDGYKCRYCDFSAKFYETAEGHIRKEHTREAIKNVCVNCGRGGWFHHGSLRTHQTRCKGKGRRKRSADQEGGVAEPKRIKPEPLD